MPTQNLNTYYYPRYKSLLNSSRYFDLTLAADERDYDEEVVFSPYVIANDDGNRLPIFYDLDNSVLTTEILNVGDASFTLEGGHNYEILEDNTLVYEYKTGPYEGQEFDKVFI